MVGGGCRWADFFGGAKGGASHRELSVDASAALSSFSWTDSNVCFPRLTAGSTRFGSAVQTKGLGSRFLSATNIQAVGGLESLG